MKRRRIVIGIVGAFALLGFLFLLTLAWRREGEKAEGQAQKYSAGTPTDVDQKRPSLTKADKNKLLLADLSKVPFQELYEHLTKRSAAEIASLAEQLEELPRGSASDNTITAFYKAWANLDPQAALVSAAGMRDRHFRSAAMHAVITAADKTAARELAETINQFPPDRLSTQDKGMLLSRAVAKWSEVSPLEAAIFLDQIGAQGMEYLTAFNSTTYNWALQDPSAALAWAQQHPDGFGNHALQGALNGWWEKEPRAAEAYVATQADGSLRGKMMVGSFVGMLYENDPAEARAWINQLSNPDARVAAIGSLAQRWALDDPRAATEWAASLPSSEVGYAVGAAARLWAKQDSKAAGDFLNSLGGNARDQAVAAFSSIMVIDDPANALTWARSIGDPVLRLKTEQNVVEGWLQQDSAAARNWIETSNLPEAEKQQLLATPPSP